MTTSTRDRNYDFSTVVLAMVVLLLLVPSGAPRVNTDDPALGYLGELEPSTFPREAARKHEDIGMVKRPTLKSQVGPIIKREMQEDPLREVRGVVLWISVHLVLCANIRLYCL